MKKIIFSMFLLGALLSANAQVPDWVWAKSSGGTGDDEVTAISTDANGNIVVTGNYNSPNIAFGTTTLTNSGSGDIFIVKYDPSGNVLWAKSAGGNGWDGGVGISTDASGNIIVTGGFSSPSIIFGTTTLTSTSDVDFFVVKYDPSGNVIWAKSTGGTGNVSTDAIGNIVITGRFFSPTVIFDSITLTKSGTFIASMNIFVVKYDPSGNVLWAKSAGGGKWDEGVGIATDAIGNIVVTGNFKSQTITFGATTLTNIEEGGAREDIFVVKYDPTGNVIWAKSGNGDRSDECKGISIDDSGNIVVIGNFNSSVIAFGATMLTSAFSGAYNIFVVKYDPNGNVLWAKSTGGASVGICEGISLDNKGDIVVTGHFYTPIIAFGATTITNNGSIGSQDIFIVKLSNSTVTGFDFNPIYNTVKVYPNPSSTQIVIDNGNYSSMGSYTAKIINALGQQVFQSVINQQQFVIDVSTMGGAGMYTLSTTDGNNNVVGVKKIVLQ